MKRTTVMIPDEVEARLKHLADLQQVSVSEVIRQAIEGHVGQRRLRSAGSGNSGRSDISSRIDEFLAEEYDMRDARRHRES